eukprot:gene16541-22676_t
MSVPLSSLKFRNKKKTSPRPPPPSQPPSQRYKPALKAVQAAIRISSFPRGDPAG